VLSGLPELKICTSYQVEELGKTVQIDYPSAPKVFARCRPIFESLPGWTENLANARGLSDLPAAARRYVDRISELVHKPVSFVSVGPDREQTIRA
jgi:adenylosuccinate synthase